MGRTGTLPTMEDSNQDQEKITDQALRYAEKRDARIAALRDELYEKEKLLNMMHDAGLTEFHDDEEGITVTIESKEKLKVKHDDDDDEPADDPG